MTKRIFRSTLLVAVVVLLCSLGLILGLLSHSFNNVQLRQLRDELQIAAAGTALGGTAFLSELDAIDYRVTWIAADGTVLYDTDADAGAMTNHADRQEFLQALETGTGRSIRQSETLLERTVYEALRLADGSVLRISRSQHTMLQLVLDMLSPAIVIVTVAAILCALLAHRISRRIVEPLNSLDLEHPLQNDAYEELSPLLRRLNQQHLQIQSQMQSLKERADEFTQIIANMREGLVLLNSEGTVLSINPTATALFCPEGDCVGKSFLAVERSQEMRNAVNDALDKGWGSFRQQRGQQHWLFDLTRIASQGNVIGAVVLAFDVTDAENAERNRREFSANVSHELKTPLQSIIGSAELLENGLVQPEDTPRFIGHIRKEAKRLVALVEDIILLSQLDEGAQVLPQQVELLELTGEILESLSHVAQANRVTLRLTGQPVTILGVRRLVHEVIYNLCENAIKYNVPGGSVTITLEGRTLTVADTGIGIPQDQQSRIFERFYRVDKSHSRASGGTGLGLSIVKHALQQLGGRLTLQSTPGKGTTVTVTF